MVDNFNIDGKSYMTRYCEITNGSRKHCTITSDKEVENMNICYNCKHWIGGGDWGLSCRKDYYIASTNGFDEACEKFEKIKS